MKFILSFLICLASVPLTSCQTTSGSDVALAVVRGGVTYAATKHLASAKGSIQWDERHAQLDALNEALTTASKEGVGYTTLRPLLAARFAGKPEIMLLADLILPYLKPAGTIDVNYAKVYLDVAVESLTAALKLPPPVYVAPVGES